MLKPYYLLIEQEKHQLPSGLMFAWRHFAKRHAWHWFRRDTSTIHLPPSLHVYSKFLLKKFSVKMLKDFFSFFNHIASRKCVDNIRTVGYFFWKSHDSRRMMEHHNVFRSHDLHRLYNDYWYHEQIHLLEIFVLTFFWILLFKHEKNMIYILLDKQSLHNNKKNYIDQNHIHIFAQINHFFIDCFEMNW